MHLKQTSILFFVPDYSIIGSAGLVKAARKKRIVYEVEKILAKGVFAMAAVAAALIFTGGTSVTAKAAVNTKSDIEIATRLHNYSRSASPIGSYLVDIGNGNMMRVQFDYDSSNIYVEYYDSQYNVTGVRQLAPELPIYGGFYSGSDAYYIVTGQQK